jgi:hypothetical protein
LASDEEDGMGCTGFGCASIGGTLGAVTAKGGDDDTLLGRDNAAALFPGDVTPVVAFISTLVFEVDTAPVLGGDPTG